MSRADEGHHFRGADPGERDGDHLVARPDSQGAQGDLQADGAAADGDAMFDANETGQGFLQFGHLGSHDELGMGEDAVDAGVYFGLVTAVLFFQINELHCQ